jgi:hypothetical protein
MGGEDNTISASDRVKMLVDSFGSKKKQKVMDSRAANKVNVHSVVGGGNFVPENVKDSAANVVSLFFVLYALVTLTSHSPNSPYRKTSSILNDTGFSRSFLRASPPRLPSSL